MNLQPYPDFAASLAYRAERITLAYFNTGIRPDPKANNQPVTMADREAERFIRAEIEREYPGHAHGESLATHAALKPEVLELIRCPSST
jgi:fructose-1,6-bisphosphatase/inositol monophosphatase family enzyme